MRILQIAPLWETVPPPAYGGTETVVHVLVEELVRRGHEVTLCASGDSRTSAQLLATYPRSLRTADDLTNKHYYAWHHAVLSLREAREFDIVHNHAGEEAMALAHLLPDVPMLTTMHCLISPDARVIWDHYSGHYNTISWAQRRLMPPVGGGRFAGVVYNAIDVLTFPFQAEKDDYLLFLTRISPEKAPHLAIEVARRTGRRLIIAGKVDEFDLSYFTGVIAPLVDGQQVVYAGEANARLKRDLYRNACALLLPIIWDEPFGLVLIEAMACGTPVIAFNRGSVPEIIRDGETGFIVDTVDEMTDAVRRIQEIDPLHCRQHVARDFDVPVMADNYLNLYHRLLERREAQIPLPAATAVAWPSGRSA